MMTLPRNIPAVMPPIFPHLIPPLPSTVFLAGRMGVGKSTLARELCKSEPGYTRLALADALKDDVCGTFGITRADLEANKGKYRTELQQHGHGMRLLHGERYWIHRWELARWYIKGPVVCDDVRYPNEAVWARSVGSLVRVWVPVELRMDRLLRTYGFVSPDQLQHASERDVEALAVDAEIRGDLPRYSMLSSLYSALGAVDVV